jgi:tetratricopeptide (TPR) repeat protein
MEALEERFSDFRRGGFNSMKMGEVPAAGVQFQEAHDVAERLTEVEPENAKYQVMLALSCSLLSRAAIGQGKVEECRQWSLKLIQTQRRLVGLPGVEASLLNGYAWDLLICEPADLRDPVAALPVAQEAVERSGRKDADILDTLALAYFMTGDTAKAIETQEQAVALLPPGDPSRKDLEATLAKFHQGATSQPTSQPTTQVGAGAG